MAETVTFAALRAANIARQAEWCPDQVPDLSFRGNELAGEGGEAMAAALDLLGVMGALAAAIGRVSNTIKKIERERHGWVGSRATLEQLAEELADVEICADLCAMTAGIDLGAAVVAKFNATSEKVGLATRLRPEEMAPSIEALKAAVELEIQAAIGTVTTRSIGALIDRVAEARIRDALATREAARG